MWGIDRDEKKDVIATVTEVFNNISSNQQKKTIRMSVKWTYRDHEIVVNAGHPEVLIEAVKYIKTIQHKMVEKRVKKGE